MSRIVVKQLPKNITEQKVKELFSKKGTITDVQLKYTPDGKFRQFCFIGYHSEQEANDAIHYFNNTCIQTSRIKVELCASLGSDTRSKFSKAAKAERESKLSEKAPVASANKKEKVPKILEILGDHKDDPEFQEFLKVHDKKRTLWANDVDIGGKLLPDQDEGIHSENEDDTPVSGDENVALSEDVAEAEAESVDDGKLAEKPISDLEYMKSLITKSTASRATQIEVKKKKTPKESLDLFTIKMHNVPYKVKRQEILKFLKPLKPYSVRLPTKVHGFCYVGFRTEKEMAKAMLKNKSFIKGKQIFFSDFTEKNKITKSNLKGAGADNDDGGNAKAQMNPKWTKQLAGIESEENISETGCIFFRNLSYMVTEEDLQKLFEQFGPVAEVNLPVDSVTRQIKGFGTVTFVMPEHALLAFNQLDGTDFHGRLLHLIPAKNKDKDLELDADDAENTNAMSFKQKKTAKLKKNAQQANTWNTLFLGQNAVVEILSKQFGMSKEKILNTSGEAKASAAVRMALGETQIVIEMKKFLEEQGVRLKSFDAPNMKRSKTIILVKNLPAETSVAELMPIFGKFGPIGRIVLPPSGVTALVEYCAASEARQAFKKLAYSKFKHVPLYLEWAPEDTFNSTYQGEPIKYEEGVKEEPESTKELSKGVFAKDDEVNNDPAEAVKPKSSEEVDSDEWANEPPEPNTTIFLRNLNFNTVRETVLEHFKCLGPIHSVEIAKRRDPENTRALKSLGYGFIQFKRAETAVAALKDMQFTHIDGNQVELKRSDRTLRSELTVQRKKVSATKQTGTKILVRNIPFQAKSKEVYELFKTFGEIRSLRLPKKMAPGEESHRGFGFVDYLTKADAKRAFDALSQSTHLYGRRLVLEWASLDDDSNIEELRKRTAAQMAAVQSAGKRSKKSVFNVDDHIGDKEEDDE